MNTSAIASFLKEKVSPFRDISIERLQPLVEGSRVGSFEAGETIMHQGDKATHFGVALSGTIHASALGDAAARHSLGRLKAGDTFNELALMTGGPVVADFVAESRCEVMLIPVSLFQSVIVAEPAAVQHISRTIAGRMTTVMADPLKASVALRWSDDPYGLKLKGERPEKILVINCGSSSLKYSFYDTADEARQARGQVERIGIGGTQLAHRGPKGRIERVRILGPTRKYTQIEIAMTEQFKLGVAPPIRESGDIADTPGCMLESPTGCVKVDCGVICALRHIHMAPADALRYGVRDKSFVRVRIPGDRELVFGDVLVRVASSFSLAMHIDTDEANAANIRTGAQGYIEGIQSEG